MQHMHLCKKINLFSDAIPAQYTKLLKCGDCADCTEL